VASPLANPLHRNGEWGVVVHSTEILSYTAAAKEEELTFFNATLPNTGKRAREQLQHRPKR